MAEALRWTRREIEKRFPSAKVVEVDQLSQWYIKAAYYRLNNNLLRYEKLRQRISILEEKLSENERRNNKKDL